MHTDRQHIGLDEKLDGLRRLLKSLGDFCIAFSGGVDSSFMLAAAKQVTPENLLAVTAASGFVPRKEIARAKRIAAGLGVSHLIVDVDVLESINISGNPPDRCYHCKKAVFSRILSESMSRGIHTLLHAVNLDDLGDYRPGLEAATELGVLSPLVETGFSKNDIRQASRMMGLETWNKPSQSCLATRIPYNTVIRESVLHRVEKAEDFLFDMGFDQVRVRVHDTIARIEVLPDRIGQIMEPDNRNRISKAFRNFGFRYVSVDMDGYTTGKMNNEILSGKTGQDICPSS